jgi:large subunit ribosomal protein L15
MPTRKRDGIMIELSNLKEDKRKVKKIKRVGRGPSSGMGKTSTRGHNGMGSRSGCKKRYTYEGGQFRLFQKLPCRGFTRGRFKTKYVMAINLFQINKFFEDGEVVSLETLIARKFVSKNHCNGIKVLANGNIDKKVTIEAKSFSKEAMKKLEEKKISYKALGK